MSTRVCLYILFTISLSNACDAQVFDYNGTHVTCDERSVLDQALNARNLDYFAGWTDQSFRDAESLIDFCKPTVLFGKAKVEAEQVLRHQILNEMKTRLIAAERDKQQQQAQAYAQQIQAKQQSDDRELDQLRRNHQQCSHAGRRVRVFAADNVRRVTCSSAPKESLNTILFLDEPCSLPLADAAHMHRAWMASGAYQVGCWYPTVDDGFVFVGAMPELTRKSEISWKSYPQGALRPDGSVTIVEPNFDSNTFMSNVENARAMEVFKHRNEKP
ncbi:MAG: hypothetical protein JSR66_03140 [Proteobacteria bacterium]|nr:hypothetical protein [Pseudomonadota bacterium]